MNNDQLKTPLLSKLKELAHKSHAPFYAPGHKRGRGISNNLQDLMGELVFKADLPELPELDNLFAPETVIKEAQNLASKAFGAEKSWFLINGSTCGIIASILATCRSGDKIILPRNIHQSAIFGLIISGAIPIFINPEYNPEFDLSYSITTEGIKRALQQHPDTKAVMVVYPTYHGVCGHLQEICDLTHQYNIPLLVDEAHGAHFHFHPSFPPSALECGADLTIQSTHKVLGAMTQASMLHIQGSRIEVNSLNKALQLVQSSSPSYLLLASLDAARQQMAIQGRKLLTQTLNLARQAREKISKIEDLLVFSLNKSSTQFYNLDETRLTINVTELGLTGYEADEILDQHLGVTAELPSLTGLTFIISIGNSKSDLEQLVRGLEKLSGYKKISKNPLLNLDLLENYAPTSLISPREAFFSQNESVIWEKSRGQISAEIICPYPPGIPILMPGEFITSEALEYLKEVTCLGAIICGCSDSTLKTIKVIQGK
jgi:arginine/lysine/ornithine decarboxylase